MLGPYGRDREVRYTPAKALPQHARIAGNEVARDAPQMTPPRDHVHYRNAEILIEDGVIDHSGLLEVRLPDARPRQDCGIGRLTQ